MDVRPSLYFFPRAYLCCAVRCFRVAEDVRVAPAQFLIDACEHICHRKLLFLFGNGGLKRDMEHHIAEFGAEFIPIGSVDRFNGFVGFFDETLAE
jgi:hypothetical protein